VCVLERVRVSEREKERESDKEWVFSLGRICCYVILANKAFFFFFCG